MRHVILEMDQDETVTGPEIAKSVTLLDAVLWLKKAWAVLKPSTATKCFSKCGFCPTPSEDGKSHGMVSRGTQWQQQLTMRLSSAATATSKTTKLKNAEASKGSLPKKGPTTFSSTECATDV